MKRRIVLIMIVAFIALGAGIVLSKAVKVDLMPYAAVGYGSGQAILNYAKGADTTQVQVNCWGLIPNTEYTVYLFKTSFLPIGSFITMKNGSGNLHFSLAGDYSGAVPVAVNDTLLNLTILLGY